MTEYKGHSGRILAESDAILVVRDTLASKASHGGVPPWRIPLQAITDVRLAEATPVKNGKIQILVGTATPSDGGAASADTVIFTHGQREQFGQLADWLRAVAKVNAESGVDSSSVPMGAPPASRGLGGRIQAGLHQAQAHVDTAQAAAASAWNPRGARREAKSQDAAAPADVGAPLPATSSAWNARGLLFEGKSHDAGRNATVTLYPDRIERIKERSRVSLSSAKQDVEVTPIRAVSSVQAKKDGMLWTKVTVYASGNTIEFRFGHDEANRFRGAITQLILSQGQAVSTASSPVPDVMDQLKKLGELRDTGVLTPEEFERKKADLLARM
jgi:hypothetical protein